VTENAPNVKDTLGWCWAYYSDGYYWYYTEGYCVVTDEGEVEWDNWHEPDGTPDNSPLTSLETDMQAYTSASDDISIEDVKY